MTGAYRFRTMFFRQWLNSIGIPLIVAMLLLVIYPNAVTFAALTVTVAVFLAIAYFGRGEEVRERSVALMLASFGIAVAILCFAFATRSVKRAEEYLGKETEAVGYVTYKEDGSADLSSVTINGKLSLKKLRLQTEEALPYGAKLRVAFLSTQTQEKSALQDGVFLSASLIRWETKGESFVLSAIGSLRDRFYKGLGERREGMFLKAVLFGDRSGLAKEDQNAFQKTASSHVLAISGLHITVLVGIAYCMMDFLFMPVPWKKAVLFPIIIFLYLITGGTVSVFRASFMTLMGASAFFLKRQSDSLTSMVFAASLLLLQNPFAVTDLSFLFTFASTFAIITLASPLCSIAAESIEPYFYESGTRWLYSIASYVLTGALISAAVFLVSLPMNLLVFGEVQILSPLYSAILIPLLTPCLFIGVAFLIILLLPFDIPFVSKAVYDIIGLFLNLIRLLSASAPTAVSFGDYNVPVALFLIALLVVLMYFRCKIRTFLLLYVALTAVMLPATLFA